jgi:hypothetical protein
VVLVVLGTVPLSAYQLHAQRLQGKATFQWPQSEQAAYAANRLPSKEMLAFLAPTLGWQANDLPTLGEFRFAQLGPREICVLAVFGIRAGYDRHIVCPATQGWYWDTSLEIESPGPLAWYLVDLDGNGIHEVISSEALNSVIPTYWYDIYKFSDGQPENVSSRFPQFYKAVLLPQLNQLDRSLGELFPDEPPPAKAQYARMVLLFLQLKYRRRILGDAKAGLEEGLNWMKSPYVNVQGLGLETLADIRDPRSIAALEELGRTTRIQGMCVNVENALAGLEGRTPDTKRILQCGTMTPQAPRMLQ